MRHSMHAYSAMAAGAVLSLLAVPLAFGLEALPPLEANTLSAGLDTVLTTHNPTRKQERAIDQILKLLTPGRRNAAQPHQDVGDVKKIVRWIGNRFEPQLPAPAFDVGVCNETGAWVDEVREAIQDAATDAGRTDERRIRRALDKAEQLFGQAVDARDHANGQKALQKMAQSVKQLQKVAKFLAIDIDTL